MDLDPTKLTKLANEVAMDIRDLDVVLRDYGYSKKDYAEIEQIQFYRDALEQSKLEWNSAKSVHERIKLQSAIMLEEAFPVLGARMRSKEEPLPAAVETAKLLAKITGLGEPKQQQTSNAEKFVITINLGGDTKGPPKVLDFEKDVVPLQIEAKDKV